jgi:hypothetical protein
VGRRLREIVVFEILEHGSIALATYVPAPGREARIVCDVRAAKVDFLLEHSIARDERSQSAQPCGATIDWRSYVVS